MKKSLLIILTCILFFSTYCHAEKNIPEIEMGRKVFADMRNHLDFMKNPLIKESLKKLGNQILKTLPPNKFEFEIFPIRSNEMNAFALPNGYIIITDRLIQGVNKEEELAFVLAHEIAHISRHHFMNFIKKKSSLDLATLATMIIGIMVSKDNDLQEGIPAISLGLNQNFTLKYSRKHEFEADHYGMRYLLNSDFNCNGALEFMKKLQRLERLTISIPAYLSTHPSTNDRINNIDGLISASKNINKNVSIINIERLKLWCALESESVDELKNYFLSKYKLEKNNIDLIYSLAKINEKLGNTNQAAIFYKKGFSLAPYDIDISRDYGMFLFRNGEIDIAKSQLINSLDNHPNDFLSAHYLGRCLFDLNLIDNAIVEFEKSVDINPDFPDNYNFLGILYNKKNELDKSHENFNQYFSLIGDKFSAKFHKNKINLRK